MPIEHQPMFRLFFVVYNIEYLCITHFHFISLFLIINWISFKYAVLLYTLGFALKVVVFLIKTCNPAKFCVRSIN